MQSKQTLLFRAASTSVLVAGLALAGCSSDSNNENGPTGGSPPVDDGTTTGGDTTGGATTGGDTTGADTTGGATTGGDTTGGDTTGGDTTGGDTTGGDTTGGDTTGGDTTGGDTTDGDTTGGDTTGGAATGGDTTGGDTTGGDTTGGDTTGGDTTGGDTTGGDLEPPADDQPDFFNAELEVPADTAPANGLPSIPQNLRVDLIGNDWVELNWAASADNGEVVEYRLSRNDGVTYSIRGDQTDISSGTQREIEKYWSTTSFIDCNYTRFLERLHQCAENRPTMGAQYTYTIAAIDNEGNESGESDPLTVTLYDTSGSPVVPYEDPYLATEDTFPFTTDFSTTDNFLGDFQLVFADEFNGTELDASRWNSVLTWGHNEAINGEQQYFVDILNDPDFGYNPFKMTGTTLAIEAIKTPPELAEKAQGQPFLSGALSTHDKFGFTYGYAEGRMKVGGVSGQLSSFYLFRRWEAEHSPEIDIVEYLGENPFGDEDAFQTYHFRDTVHGETRSSPTMFVKKDSGLYSDDFHTFGVLWEPGLVIWYIDGQEVKRLSGPQISRQSMNIVTYLVTGSEWAPTPPADDSVYPLTYEIDYVRVYQRGPYVR